MENFSNCENISLTPFDDDLLLSVGGYNVSQAGNGISENGNFLLALAVQHPDPNAGYGWGFAVYEKVNNAWVKKGQDVIIPQFSDEGNPSTNWSGYGSTFAVANDGNTVTGIGDNRGGVVRYEYNQTTEQWEQVYFLEFNQDQTRREQRDFHVRGVDLSLLITMENDDNNTERTLKRSVWNSQTNSYDEVYSVDLSTLSITISDNEEDSGVVSGSGEYIRFPNRLLTWNGSRYVATAAQFNSLFQPLFYGGLFKHVNLDGTIIAKGPSVIYMDNTRDLGEVVISLDNIPDGVRANISYISVIANGSLLAASNSHIIGGSTVGSTEIWKVSEDYTATHLHTFLARENPLFTPDGSTLVITHDNLSPEAGTLESYNVACGSPSDECITEQQMQEILDQLASINTKLDDIDTRLQAAETWIAAQPAFWDHAINSINSNVNAARDSASQTRDLLLTLQLSTIPNIESRLSALENE